MKTKDFHFRGVNSLLFVMLCFIFASSPGWTQTTSVFARATYQKVEQGKEQEFIAMLKDNWKPAHKIRLQNGKIIRWALYRVHFAGASNEYNYVSVSYYDSWEKTEANDNYSELMKAANPKVDAAAILAKTLTLRTIAKQELFSRTDAATPSPSPAKFYEIDFMKVKEGQGSEYEKVEKEVWKPVHQALINEGKRSAWGLWSLVFPAGSNSTYDYATTNGFSAYKQMAEEGYEEAFKKAHPGKDMQALLNGTEKTRNLVRRELWELIDSL